MSSISDPFTEQQHALVGTLLRGTYEVKKLLDHGGMGIVFEGEQVRLNRKVAIKVLPGHLAREPQALLRFQREAEIVSSLQHPNVVQIVDFDTTENGEPYIVMEFLPGESLAARLARDGKMPLEFAVGIATQVASGLAAVHDALIVHRDLKPANIFLSQLPAGGAHVKLLDFGIGKRLNTSQNLTGENDVIGTPDYMPPEQAAGKTAHVDQRSDQYSLAVIVYEMLAGRTPFLGDMATILSLVVNDEPTPIEELVPHLPARVGSVLRRAMAKEPNARFETITAFAGALAAAAANASPEPSTNTTLRLTSEPGVLSGASDPDRAEEKAVLMGLSATLPAAPSLASLKKALDRAKKARSLRDLDMAAKFVEHALAIADVLANSSAADIIVAEEALIEGALEMRLGRRDRPLLLAAAQSSAGPALLPEEAFLLSRIDGVATAEEVLDLSPLPRLRTLRLLVRMLRRELILNA
ncbi:MAG TPA: serine/threonine-protein kinase [Polyangiaceae bacterium]|nr:serine/threonine-protein kinase [Polyangiaceae bacterium]